MVYLSNKLYNLSGLRKGGQTSKGKLPVDNYMLLCLEIKFMLKSWNAYILVTQQSNLDNKPAILKYKKNLWTLSMLLGLNLLIIYLVLWVGTLR